MARLPDEFRDQFDEKGDTFYEIAELLYTNPDRQFTQSEIAEEVDRSNTTVSNHSREMVMEEWIDQRKDQTTFAWNTDAHNPASTEGISAVKRLYADLWQLLKKHSETVPGAFAIIGFTLIIAAVVLFVFFMGFSLGLARETTIPKWVYLTIAIGSLLGGIMVTFLSPMQAVVNRILWRIFPGNLFERE